MPENAKIFVTKEIPPDSTGLEKQLPPRDNFVPLNLATSFNVNSFLYSKFGPKKKNGEIVPYTVLGDLEDYIQMLKEYKLKPDETETKNV